LINPISHAEILKAASPFIESLNGGPDPADALDNDTVILNFALLLEHLEAEFYRVNVQTSSSKSNRHPSVDPFCPTTGPGMDRQPCR